MKEVSTISKRKSRSRPQNRRQQPRPVNKGYGDAGASWHKKATKGFRAMSGSPKEDIDANNYTLRQRARMLYMAAPIATSAIRTNRTNVVGIGLQLKSRIDREALGMTQEAADAWQAQAEREFALWSENKRACDATGVNNFAAMQQLALSSWLVSGDVFAVVKQYEPTPLTPYSLRLHLIEAARRITEQFDGKLRISYSGGATVYNIRALYDAGIWPVTLATDVLKPGGYERFSQMVGEFTDLDGKPFAGVSLKAVTAIQADSLTNPLYKKLLRPLPDRKVAGKSPLSDCFTTPCRTSCPIQQDIPAYLAAVDEGRYEDALNIIIERNALPFITGTICPHPCGRACERAFYEPEGAQIRASKLKAAREAMTAVLPKLRAQAIANDGERNVAVIGGGPAGLATAFFLTRAGVPVTIFEARDSPGGVVRHIIPEFRIASDDISHDAELCLAFGAKVQLNARVDSIDELKAQGFTDVVVATGAWMPGSAGLGEGAELDVLEFLEAAKKGEKLELGEDVVVIGAGNTAMDAARVAKRLAGVKNVRLVYRRTKKQMPADEEELDLALADGVEFCELLAPKALNGAVLTCDVNRSAADR